MLNGDLGKKERKQRKTADGGLSEPPSHYFGTCTTPVLQMREREENEKAQLRTAWRSPQGQSTERWATLGNSLRGEGGSGHVHSEEQESEEGKRKPTPEKNKRQAVPRSERNKTKKQKEKRKAKQKQK
jgi:hypothetical protein